MQGRSVLGLTLLIVVLSIAVYIGMERLKRYIGSRVVNISPAP